MAKPSTREELKQYCLRTLGKPVIEINVEDDQLEDRIDEGLQFFQEYHFDGVERMYNIHRITGSTVKIASNTGAFTVGEKITGGTSNATAIIHGVTSSTVLTFKEHKDGNGLRAANTSGATFTSGETVTGSSSGATGVPHGTQATAVSFGNVDLRYLTLDDTIIGIRDVLPISRALSANDMFSVEYQFNLNELPNVLQGAGGLRNFALTKQNLSLLNDMFSVSYTHLTLPTSDLV